MKTLNTRAVPVVILLSLAVLSGGVGCSSVPPAKVITIEERIKLNDSLGQELSSALRAEIKIQKDLALSEYFEKIAQRIAAVHPELKLSRSSVEIVKDQNEVWMDYALPGNRIYLSSGALKRTAFENEVAASLALQLAHVLNQHLAKKIEDEKQKKPPVLGEEIVPVFFGPAGLLTYSEKEVLEAIESAVSLMYQAGYDPRGLVSNWQKFQKNRKNSPYDPRSIVKFLEKTRQTIAVYSPLRNPVVSSEEFLKLKKRMQRL